MAGIETSSNSARVGNSSGEDQTELHEKLSVSKRDKLNHDNSNLEGPPRKEFSNHCLDSGIRMTALAQETVNKLLDFNQKLDINLLVSFS